MPTTKKLFQALVCPECRSKLEITPEPGRFACSHCAMSYEAVKGTPVMLSQDRKNQLDFEIKSWNNNELLPHFLSYQTIQRLKAPAPFKWFGREKILNALLSSLDPEGLYLNIGGTGEIKHDSVFNLNIMNGHDIHLVADGEKMPFPDNSVDGIFILLVLEHVPDPASICSEIHRVLKPGGFVFATLPFMQVLHAHPKDYYRFTPDGIRKLFQGFIEKKLEIASGPTGSLIWILKEYFALLFPFSNYDIIYVSVREITGWILYPLILLDLYLNRKKRAEKMASYLYYHGLKKSDTNSTPLRPSSYEGQANGHE